MLKFKKLAESILKEYWGHNPYDDEPDWDKYDEWLDMQDYNYGYAVFLGKNEEKEDVFALADKSGSGDPEYYRETYLMYSDDPTQLDVFIYSPDNKEEENKAKQQAENFANEWKQFFPNDTPEVVEVYARDEDGYPFYREKSDVYDLEYYEDDSNDY